MGLAASARVARAGWAVPAGAWSLSGGAGLLLVLNLLDGLFTLTFLQLGVAEELNPLMRWAYERSPLVFMALKLAIVDAGLVLLCACRTERASRLAIAGGALTYALITVYHVAFLCHLALNG